jgi:hypothetical protein
MHAHTLLAPCVVVAACGAQPNAARISALPAPSAVPDEVGWHVETVQRWPLGGELVSPSSSDVWVRFGTSCGVARLRFDGPVETVSPPDDHCSTASVAGRERLVYGELGPSRSVESYRVADAAGKPLYDVRSGRLLAAGDRLFREDHGSLAALAADGSVDWSVPVGEYVETSLVGLLPRLHVIHDQLVLVDRPTHESRYRVRWIDLSTGRVAAETTWRVPGHLAGADGEIAALVGSDEVVRLIAMRDGEHARWNVRVPSHVEAVTITPRYVFIDSVPEYFVHDVYALSRSDGRVLWSQRVRAAKLGLIADDQRDLRIRDNIVAELDRNGHERWTWSLPGTPAGIVRVGEDRWLASGLDFGTELFRIDRTRRDAPVHLAGRARIDGISGGDGVSVTIDGRWSTVTRGDGTFELDIPMHGTLELWASAPSDARMQALAARARANGAFTIETPPDIRRLDTQHDQLQGLDIHLVPYPVTAPD